MDSAGFFVWGVDKVGRRSGGIMEEGPSQEGGFSSNREEKQAPQVALVVRHMPDNAGDTRDVGSIPGSGRSPGEGNGNPLQYPCLENPMDRGAWRATVHGVAKSRTRLSNFTFTFTSSKPHLPNSVHEKYVTGKGKL